MRASLGIMNRMNSRPSDEDGVRGRLLLDSVTRECSRLAGKDEPLLVRGNAFLIQDLDKKTTEFCKAIILRLKK